MPGVPVRDLAALRRALARVIAQDAVVPALVGGTTLAPRFDLLLTNEAASRTEHATSGATRTTAIDDRDLATSSAADETERLRLIGLVELARDGDKEAFGLLYDHYHASVYRFLYYRLGSVHLAEDLTADTFFRALRSMNGFRWQGRDFGAWLMTIARNLTTDHYKSSRTRLERVTEDERTLDATADGPEGEVLGNLTSQALMTALRELPADQQDCLVMRFLDGLSLAETAEVMERSAGAIKQLQLRAIRNLAKHVPEGLR